MAKEAAPDPTGQLSAPQLAALLAAHGVREAPERAAQPLGWQGVLASCVDPPPPELALWGWEGRTPTGARCGEEIIMRAQGEPLDAFRLRLHYAWGGPLRVAHFVYRKDQR